MSKPAASATPDVERVGMSAEEVAHLLGVSVNHVRRQAAEGSDSFPRGRLLGKRRIWDRESVLAWVRRDLTVTRAGVAIQVR